MSEAEKEYSDVKRALLERYLGSTRAESASNGAALARRRPAPAQPPAGVVTVQAGGSRPPFFYLHGQWKDGGFHCFRLAQALGSDQPFYAVEPFNLVDVGSPPSFEAIASDHVKSIRAIQPRGPYRLGGWCNGGLLAYEMSRQLVAEGQEVELLVLMDPVWLVYPRRLRMLRTMTNGVRNVAGLDSSAELDRFLQLRHAYRIPRHVYSYARYGDYRRSRDWRFGRQDYPGIYDWIALGYKPASLYPGKVTFFWTSTQPFRSGWQAVEAAGKSELHILSGRHMTSLNTHLPELAERLRRVLENQVSIMEPRQGID